MIFFVSQAICITDPIVLRPQMAMGLPFLGLNSLLSVGVATSAGTHIHEVLTPLSYM